MSTSSFADKILTYHWQISTDLELPGGVDWLYPYGGEEVRRVMGLFFRKYFSDQKSRYALIGINPGRFGAGITGLPFTDPIRMEEVCGIGNAFQKRQELSSVFVYEVIEALGGPEAFYRHFYFTSVCPLGFVKGGKNYNYYDDKKLEAAVMPMILDNLKRHREMGVSGKIAFSMGQGQNFKILKRINGRHAFFDEILPLPHPRWVMQYRRKRKDEFVHMYVKELQKALGKG